MSSNNGNQDALNALQNLGSAPAPAGNSQESTDASGFVGMLARGSQNEPDPAGQPRPAAPQPAAGMPRPTPRPSPKAAPAAAPKIQPGLDAIPMAKEIEFAAPEPQHAEAALEQAAAPFEPAAAPAEPTTPVPPAPGQTPQAPTANYRSRRKIRVPNWYRTAIPISFTIGGLLFIVGAWSLLAVLSAATKSNMAPGFDYNVEGVAMPVVLLLSLPVSITLSIMGMIMSKQVRQMDEQTRNGA